MRRGTLSNPSLRRKTICVNTERDKTEWSTMRGGSGGGSRSGGYGGDCGCGSVAVVRLCRTQVYQIDA